MLRWSLCLCVLVAVGCAQMPATTALPATNRTESWPTRHSNAAKAKFDSLYVFGGEPDGAVPVGGLTPLKGTLYGTTNFGGDSSPACYPGDGCGTIYKMTTAGTETVIYRFKDTSNGLRPYAGLTVVGTKLFGTTQNGGKSNDGVVFSVTTSGAEKAVFAFNGTNGEDPRANLIDVNGVIYGTTYRGGSAGDGTVFSLTASGNSYTEKVLHSFQGGADGALPLGGVISVNGTLYGTTSAGGTDDNGTVFSIDASGKEKVLHSFAGGQDGATPFAGVTADGSALYGTTSSGGNSSKGTVFKITTGGSESVIYSFADGNDGAVPLAALTLVSGKLYGTTAYGNSKNDGTIYSITTAGSETTLYRFTGQSDGRLAAAAVTAIGSTLYGTTNSGGNTGIGDGTAYKFIP